MSNTFIILPKNHAVGTLSSILGGKKPGWDFRWKQAMSSNGNDPFKALLHLDLLPLGTRAISRLDDSDVRAFLERIGRRSFGRAPTEERVGFPEYYFGKSSASSALLQAAAATGSLHEKKWLYGELKLWGVSRSEIIKAVEVYKNMTSAERLESLISTAAKSLKLKPSPSLLCFSPFSNHASDLQELLDHPQVVLPSPLKIACYGAGFNSDADFIRSQSSTRNPDFIQAVNFLEQLEEKILGPNRGISYEPREILSLFLPGTKPGQIHVFDNHPKIEEDLRNPEMPIINVRGTYYGRDEEEVEYTQKYFKRITDGRHLVVKRHAIYDGRPVASAVFRFQDEEINKIQVHSSDLVQDQIEGGPFDVSFFMDTHYFYSFPIQMLLWMKVIQNTKIDGYIVSDMRLEERVYKSMGLEKVSEVWNPVCQKLGSYVYRKERDEFSVKLFLTL